MEKELLIQIDPFMVAISYVLVLIAGGCFGYTMGKYDTENKLQKKK